MNWARIKELRIARAKRIACSNCPAKRKLDNLNEEMRSLSADYFDVCRKKEKLEKQIADMEQKAEKTKWEYEDMVDHWMGKAQNYEARCDALQRVIDSLCRGYDSLTAAVTEIRYGKK